MSWAIKLCFLSSGILIRLGLSNPYVFFRFRVYLYKLPAGYCNMELNFRVKNRQEKGRMLGTPISLVLLVDSQESVLLFVE